MSTTINRRGLVRGAAWAAPVVVATAAVPAYAASFTCPEGDRTTFGHTQVSSSTSISHEVTASYALSGAAAYKEVVLTANEVMTLVGTPSGVTLSADGKTLTVLNNGSSDIAFSVKFVIADEVATASGYALSLTSTVDGQCSLVETFNSFTGSAG